MTDFHGITCLWQTRWCNSKILTWCMIDHTILKCWVIVSLSWWKMKYPFTFLCWSSSVLLRYTSIPEPKDGLNCRGTFQCIPQEMSVLPVPCLKHSVSVNDKMKYWRYTGEFLRISLWSCTWWLHQMNSYRVLDFQCGTTNPWDTQTVTKVRPNWRQMSRIFWLLLV